MTANNIQIAKCIKICCYLTILFAYTSFILIQKVLTLIFSIQSLSFYKDCTANITFRFFVMQSCWITIFIARKKVWIFFFRIRRRRELFLLAYCHIFSIMQITNNIYKNCSFPYAYPHDYILPLEIFYVL